MHQTMTGPGYAKLPLLMYLITTIIITMSLFYVDEGFYSFDWMTNPGNWFVFIIYATSIFAGQLLIYLLMVRVFKIRQNNLAIILLGASLAVLFLVTIVFG
jgi:hypothetical protein